MDVIVCHMLVVAATLAFPLPSCQLCARPMLKGGMSVVNPDFLGFRKQQRLLRGSWGVDYFAQYACLPLPCLPAHPPASPLAHRPVSLFLTPGLCPISLLRLSL